MIFKNPKSIHSPLAGYSHQVEIGANAKWLVLSGQLGMNKNNLVKLVFYFVEQHDSIQRCEVLNKVLGEHLPCMTVLYVAGLVSPSFKVEIDAWACSE